MKSLFIKLAQKFLNRPDLVFSAKIPMHYYFRIAGQRVMMLLRGVAKGCFFGTRGKRLYIGKHTSLLCTKSLHVGFGVSIQDKVVINALSTEGVYLADNCSVGINTSIKVSGSLAEIGKGFWLGSYSSLANDCFVGAAGGVKIGKYVAIGQNVRFHSENHEYSDINKKICEQGTTHKGIEIGDDCWIGAGAVFLDGSKIGKGCVVGANALVTTAFPNYAVIAGVPAKIIKMRK